MSVIVKHPDGKQVTMETSSITMPPSAGEGAVINIKNTNATPITIAPSGTDTIDGMTSITIYTNTSLTIEDAILGSWSIV